MTISIIIPVYRKMEYLDKCLESLAKQTYRDFEVIIIDDGNSDGLKSLKFKSLKLKLFKQQHQGSAIARNLGAEESKGEILVFVDADMTFERDFLKDLVSPILKSKTRGTFSKNELVANWENVWARCWNYNFHLPAKKRLPDNYPDHAPVFRAILKSEFDKVGGFDSKGYNDDWTLSEKLVYQAQAVKGAIYYHYNPESLTEVFQQAKWRVKRKYKLGLWGELGNLFIFTLPFSIILGSLKAISRGEPELLIFKIIFDLGSFLGLLEKILLHKYY